MDFKEKMEDYIRIIDESIKATMTSENTYHSKLFESMNYSLFTGGKRIRPILALEACRIFSGEIEGAMAFAVAIEMIHTYSLVHDDLPAMDNDDMRRGKATNHKVFGEDLAILTGDSLLNYAFETTLKYIEEESMDYKGLRKNMKALYEISKYAGTNGMIAGQVVDMRTNLADFDEEKLLFMYENKTAGLIRGALVAGALVGAASEEEVEIIREFGLNLGLAYQIQDDLLDLEEDILIEKPTYPALFGEAESLRAVESYSERAIELLHKLENKDIEFLETLTKTLVNREI